MMKRRLLESGSARWAWFLIAFIAVPLLALAADPTVASVAEPAQKIFRWRPFLAPFHAVVLHFPIGFLTVAFVLEIYRAWRPSEDLKPVTALIIWMSLVTGVVAATFGVMRAATGGYDPKTLDTHRWSGLAVPFFTFLTLILQKRAYRNELHKGLTLAYRGALSCTMLLLVMAGHQGGNLTHGSNYLVEHAPDFVREWMESDVPASAAAAVGEQQRYYLERVKPIFEAQCIKCHGAQKQKGGYRVDQPALALKGGDSGKPAIKPGDVVGSNLARLILLPPGHDDIMPPDGKGPLKSEEIMTILEWIRNGAVIPETAVKVTATGTP